MDRFEDQSWSAQFCGQKQFVAVEAFDVAKSFFVLIDNTVSCISVIHRWFVQNLILENSVAIVHFENQVIGSNCDRFTTSSTVGDGSQWKSGELGSSGLFFRMPLGVGCEPPDEPGADGGLGLGLFKSFVTAKV